MKKVEPMTLLRFSLLAIALMMLFLSTWVYITDSEFWAITLAQKLGSADWNVSVYYKTAFYSLLKILYWLPISDAHHVLTARFLFGVLSLFTAWVFFQTSMRIYSERRIAITMTALLMSTSFYLTQSFRVRSDCLSLLIHLFVVWRLFIFSRSGSSRWVREVFIFIFLNLLLLSVTPKAIYFLISGFVLASLLPFETDQGHSSMNRLRKSAFVIGAFLVPPALISIAAAGLALAGITAANEAYASALSFFIDTTNSTARDGSSFYFYHLKKFVIQNPVFVVVVAVSLIQKSPLPKKEARALKAYFFVALIALITYSEKLPFFIYSLLPSLLFISANFVSWVMSFPTKRLRACTTGISVVLIAGVLTTFHRNFFWNSNFLQLEALNYLGHFLEEERYPTYYDAIGLLPRNNRIFAFPSPKDSNNPVIAARIKSELPSLIFYVGRVLELEPQISYTLMFNYVELGAGVWARVTPLVSLPSAKNKANKQCLVTNKDFEKAQTALGDRTSSELYVVRKGRVQSGEIVETLKQDRTVTAFDCLDTDFVTRIKPRPIPLPVDLRYLFAFDASY